MKKFKFQSSGVGKLERRDHGDSAFCFPAQGRKPKPMSFPQLAAYNKPDREKVLYEGAKAEGKITWYTSLAGESYKDLAALLKANIRVLELSLIAPHARKWEHELWLRRRQALHSRHHRNNDSVAQAAQRQQDDSAVLLSDRS